MNETADSSFCSRGFGWRPLVLRFTGMGIGDYFLDSVFADIDSLKLYAGIHPKVAGLHKMLTKRFPYAVYYELKEETAIVWRVLDLRQNPTSIAQKLGSVKVTTQISEKVPFQP